MSPKNILIQATFVAYAIFILLKPEAQAAPKNVKNLRLIVIATHEAGDIDFLNRTLKRSDIIFTYGAKMKLLKRITGPKIMIGRSSVGDLEKELKRLKHFKVDYINYNPEHWGRGPKRSHTPSAEIADPIRGVLQARKLAKKYGTQLSFITDHEILEKYGTRIAPMVDMFGIQMQRYQRRSLKEFYEVAAKYVQIIRQGSPTVPVFIQISLAPPVWKEKRLPHGGHKLVLLRDQNGRKIYRPLPLESVLAQIEAVKDLCDGIAFLYNRETRDDLRKLISRLRVNSKSHIKW